MKYKNEQGVCPKCGSHNLMYDAISVAGDGAYYPYTCKDCGQEGEEWYNLEFTGHSVYDEDGEIFEL